MSTERQLGVHGAEQERNSVGLTELIVGYPNMVVTAP